MDHHHNHLLNHIHNHNCNHNNNCAFLEQMTDNNNTSSGATSAATTTTATTTSGSASARASSSQWQTLLQHANDELGKELLCVQRRYHGRVVQASSSAADEQIATMGVQLQCFISLSDPDLPSQFKGESELLITLPPGYPQVAAHVALDTWRLRMSDAQFAALTAATSARAEQLRGSYGIRKLLTWLDNNVYPVISAVEMDTGALDRQHTVACGSTEPMEPESIEEASVVCDDNDAQDAPHTNNKPATVSTNADANANVSRRQRPRSCPFFARGKCNRGDKCKFSHVPKATATSPSEISVDEGSANASSSQEPCAEEAAASEAPTKKKRRTRKKAKPAGSSPDQDQENLPSSTAPGNEQRKEDRASTKACRFYAKGKCRDGEECKFSHTRKMKSSDDSTKGQTQKPTSGIVIKVIGQAPVTSPSDTSPRKASAELAVPTVPGEWSHEQQQELDAALKKYPATMDKKIRWVSIASAVTDKSLNECIDRFKLLCSIVKQVDPVAVASVEQKREQEAQEAAASPAHHKIIAPQDRVSIETEPDTLMGTPIRFDELFLHQIGTLVPHRLVCQVQCTNCPLKFDARLSLAEPRLQKWCPRCSVLHVVSLRPVFAHAQSDIVAYVDSDNCAVVDLLPSEVLASCLDCGTEALFENIVPGRRFEQSCFECHVKLALMTKRFAVGHPVEASSKSEDKSAGGAKAAKTKATRRPVDTFVLGQPLPRNGACDHYKHSKRWFRFQCCGKAFPCDVCHDSSDCDAASMGTFASKTICGYCSKEQSSSVKECACGNEMGRKSNRSRHWEGGQGCRDRSRMATTDKQKFRGLNKTESKKNKRVGVEGKAHAQQEQGRRR